MSAPRSPRNSPSPGSAKAPTPSKPTPPAAASRTPSPIAQAPAGAEPGATARNKYNDRRRAGRVRCNLTTCQFGTVVNISRTGMRVTSRKVVPTMPAGKSTNLSITAAGRTMTVPGRPVHNRPRPDGLFEVGFQFVGITEEQLKELLELARTAFDGVLVYKRNAG